jgi:parallel beta-helix repeat protein
MKIKSALIIFLIANLMLSCAALGAAFSIPDTIYIQSDGTISPESAPISQAGSIYTLTSDIASQVVVGCNNIVFDGAGHNIRGDDWGVALELSGINVVVQNVHLANWQAGIHGVYNNNTIKDCQITDCDYGFKIYAQYYIIEENQIENNNEVIRIGIGGLHFIAGNNFVNNKVGFSLYDSDNVIVQNNIINCSEAAFVLDNTGWAQTVYRNNFVGNAKSVTDYTYSNSIERPVQSEVAPWDNGVSGNYWSDYTGADRNGDGIGDSAEQISTYYRGEVLSFYSFTDRYPLMSQYNINTAFPSLPEAFIPKLTIPVPDNQEKALSFLKEVVGLDLTKYVPNLSYNNFDIDESTVTQNVQYQLKDGSKNYALATLRFTNTSLTYFNLGLSYSSWPSQDTYEAAKTFMQTYQAWTSDSDINTMVNQLKAAEPNQNLSTFTGNMAFKIRTESMQTSYQWNYKYYGAEYTGITLTIQNSTDIYNPIYFTDNRATSKIGNTKLEVSRSEAIAIAEQYVKNNFTYPLDRGNGTVLFVNDLNVANTTAALSTASRYDSTLYPCWDLRVVLDQTYDGNVVAVNLRLWADNGAVFSARTESAYNGADIIPSVLFLGLFSSIIGLAVLAVLVVVVVVVVLVIVLKETEKPKPTKLS